MSDVHVGIDLGTTNTVVAYCNKPRRRGGIPRPRLLRINQYDTATTMAADLTSLPSVLFISNEKVYVGQYAKHIKGQGADRRILYNTKIDMGEKTNYSYGFTPVKAAAEILTVCLKNIRTNIVKSGEMPEITITVPASFTQNQIQDTLDAAKLAGFDLSKVAILEEPVAALYNYVNDQMSSGDEPEVDFSEEKRVLVYDIGGGTCDVCVYDMRIGEENEFFLRSVATNRYTEFGGNDFDELAAIGLLNKLFQRYHIAQSEIDSPEQKNDLVAKLLPICEQYKINYSDQLKLGKEYDIVPADYFTLTQFLGEYKNVELDVSWEEYKQFTQTFFEDHYTHPTRNLTDKMRDKNVLLPVYEILKRLEKAKEKPIDCIYLTGGMAQYPPIGIALQEFCKCPVIHAEDPMDAVAKGAAISSYLRVERDDSGALPAAGSEADSGSALSPEEDRPRLAEAIFIDIENSLPMKIIDAGVCIPCTGTVDHVFHVGANGVCFNLFSGESEWDPKLCVLRDYAVRFPNLVPQNTSATIRYEINANRSLQLFLDLNDYRKQKLELTPVATESTGE